ncbi:TetR/AcrR family transcriptional regulator [Blastococcus sp. SYSU DS0539]
MEMTALGGNDAKSQSSIDLAQAAVGGRRGRLSLEEVRQRVLDTARTLLVEQGGLRVSLEHINLEVIIAAANVPRSSAFRQWKTKEDFVVDFLCEVAGRPDWIGTAAFDERTITAALTAVQDNAHLLTDSPVDRRKLLDEVVRRAIARNFEILMESQAWRTYVALTAMVASMPAEEARSRILDRLHESETTFIRRMTNFYTNMSAFLGFRLRPPFTYEHLTAAGAAVIEGLALRYGLNLSLIDEPLSITADGETREWFLAAAGYKAVLDAMVEFDEDYVVPDEETMAGILTAPLESLMTEQLTTNEGPLGT